MLFAFTMDYRNHSSLVVRRCVFSEDGAVEEVSDVEIHGPSKLRMAMAVLNNYPMKLQMLAVGPAIVIEVGRDEERLFNALRKLQEFSSPIRQDADFRDFFKEPNIERLEAFMALKKLLGKTTRGKGVMLCTL